MPMPSISAIDSRPGTSLYDMTPLPPPRPKLIPPPLQPEANALSFATDAANASGDAAAAGTYSSSGSTLSASAVGSMISTSA